jgi:hypothetical protein
LDILDPLGVGEEYLNSIRSGKGSRIHAEGVEPPAFGDIALSQRRRSCVWCNFQRSRADSAPLGLNVGERKSKDQYDQKLSQKYS